ncbi:hypothetical protein Tco_0914577 [Tanacetum coccineum]
MGEADVILGIKIKHESNRIAISQSYYVEKVLKKFNYFDCTPVSTTMDTSEKLMPNNGQAVSQLEYSRVIGCLMYAMTCTRPDIAFAVGKLSRYTSNPGTQHWQAIQQASKKQICITSLTMESEFIALVVAGMEAEWLKNLLLEISSWSKPITPISIRCDSDATLEKTYSQMSQQNLAGHLTKRLARDLVIKSGEGMGLKFRGLKHIYLHIIPRICLEPAEKEDEDIFIYALVLFNVQFSMQKDDINLGRIVWKFSAIVGIRSNWGNGLGRLVKLWSRLANSKLRISGVQVAGGKSAYQEKEKTGYEATKAKTSGGLKNTEEPQALE